MQQIYKEISEALKQKSHTKDEISRLKISLSKKYGLGKIPSDLDILINAPQASTTLAQLVTKPTRTSSGVAVVAIMTKPHRCPHGRCSYCPGGINSYYGSVPQSYTGREPATMRAIRNHYDPYLQIFNRLEQYALLGHSYEKVELIVMGGTFPALSKSYRESFVAESFKAMNDFGRIFRNKREFFMRVFEIAGDKDDKNRIERIQHKILSYKGEAELAAVQRQNEHARVRCVALCVETRPDYCAKRHINEMLRLGTTRVELGVQSLNDSVLKHIKRGHTVEKSIVSTQLLKDSFFKVGYHMMPGLPLSSYTADLKMLNELFTNPDYRPDALKIYPCMVMPGTKLFREYKNSEYKPLTTKRAAQLIAKFKAIVPKYCRIMRIQRDIPTKVTCAGVDRTNLRQYVQKLMKEKGVKCRCIRCREPRNRVVDLSKINVLKQTYEASGGHEIFISAEDTKNDIIVGFCRLRIPNKPFRKEITKKSAGVRELHVYGDAAHIGEHGIIQHRGVGSRLLREAEDVAQQYDCTKMVVISGIGARAYYRKHGYKKQGPYMVKRNG
ncbi:MAG: tRNA uridine(34) 5-carboxymethylaminomethyl modification radical SAM/GNAT enzyme Elp3 [Candidatus Woesearchaeota archaeon]